VKRRPLIAAGIAGALLMGSAGIASATATAAANRLFGENREATAIAVAKATFAPGSTVAILVNGRAPADAVAASFISGATLAPVLLTNGDVLSAAVLTALADLDVEGVIMVGGTNVLGNHVVDGLEDAGYGVARIQGGDRYETAAKIATYFPKETVGSFMAGPAAFIARSDVFADALAAGPLSSSQRMPILLTESGALNTHAKSALTSLGIKQVVVLGGPTIISPAVETELVGMGIAVRRVAGATRQDTAVDLARIAVGELNFPLTRVLLAQGDEPQFADALAGASRGGVLFAPLLLTVSRNLVGGATTEYIKANTATIATIDVLGGTSAITDTARDAAVAAARGQ
jgi:putative cell wall-binding protein